MQLPDLCACRRSRCGSPVLALAAAPITTDSYWEYALPFVMFVCTVFFGQWLVDKVERSEWRQKLREEANAAKSARAADPDQKGLPPRRAGGEQEGGGGEGGGGEGGPGSAKKKR